MCNRDCQSQAVCLRRSHALTDMSFVFSFLVYGLMDRASLKFLFNFELLGSSPSNFRRPAFEPNGSRQAPNSNLVVPSDVSHGYRRIPNLKPIAPSEVSNGYQHAQSSRPVVPSAVLNERGRPEVVLGESIGLYVVIEPKDFIFSFVFFHSLDMPVVDQRRHWRYAQPELSRALFRTPSYFRCSMDDRLERKDIIERVRLRRRRRTNEAEVVFASGPSQYRFGITRNEEFRPVRFWAAIRRHGSNTLYTDADLVRIYQLDTPDGYGPLSVDIFRLYRDANLAHYDYWCPDELDMAAEELLNEKEARFRRKNRGPLHQD